MYTVIINRIQYSHELSRALGEAASQQRQAYNHAVEYALAHPNTTRFDLFKSFAGQRTHERWTAHVNILRAGLTRGLDSVKKFDDATKNTLKECIKEMDGKRFKDVKQSPDIQRLFRSRKARLSICVDDVTGIQILNSYTIKVAGLTLNLTKSIPCDTRVKAVQVLERKDSLRKGRNRPLSARTYDCNLVIEVPDSEPKEPFTSTVGLDVGITHTVADSYGGFHDQPVFSPVRLGEMKQQQKKYRRGSVRWCKLQRLISKERRYIRNCKREWEIKTARVLAQSHSLISMEDLRHMNLRRSSKGTNENPGINVRAKTVLNRSWSETRVGDFTQTVVRQAEKAGASVVFVDSRFTSQTCSVCGLRAKESRKSQAEFLCLNCNAEMNADTNAARNVDVTGKQVYAFMLLCCMEAHRRMGEPSSDAGWVGYGVFW